MNLWRVFLLQGLAAVFVLAQAQGALQKEAALQKEVVHKSLSIPMCYSLFVVVGKLAIFAMYEDVERGDINVVCKKCGDKSLAVGTVVGSLIGLIMAEKYPEDKAWVAMDLLEKLVAGYVALNNKETARFARVASRMFDIICNDCNKAMYDLQLQHEKGSASLTLASKNNVL